MKNKNGKTTAMLTVVAIAAAVIFTGTGCRTVTSTDPIYGTNVVTRVPDVALMCTTAQSAAYLGSVIYLNGLGSKNFPAHPEARPQFELARTSLRALIAGGSFDGAQLTAALQGLPIQELQGAQGSLIVGEAVILWDQYGQQLARLDKAQIFATYVLPVAKSILDGLDMALGPPSPSSGATSATPAAAAP